MLENSTPVSLRQTGHFSKWLTLHHIGQRYRNARVCRNCVELSVWYVLAVSSQALVAEQGSPWYWWRKPPPLDSGTEHRRVGPNSEPSESSRRLDVSGS